MILEKNKNQMIKINLGVHRNIVFVHERISWHWKEYAKINNETDISLCVSFFHYNHMPSVALDKHEELSPWRAEEWRDKKKKKKVVGGQVRLSGETKGLGHLGNMCPQKSAVAGICDSGENRAEPVVQELRYMFKIISLRTYCLMLMACESWLNS